MKTIYKHLISALVLTSTVTGCDVEHTGLDEGSSIEMRSGITVHDAADDFNDQNPNGVWSYGYGSIGGDFTASPDYHADATFAYRGGGVTSDGWRGLHKNLTGAPQGRHQGLVFPANALVMHPGNSANHLTKVRFTAPTDGCYDVDVTFTNIDEQAKTTRPMIYTNAVEASGTVYGNTPEGFKEVFAENLVGFNASASFGETLSLAAGDVVSFELGHGGDGYYDDSVTIEAQVIAAECPSDKFFLETFEQSDVGPHLVDLQSTFAVDSGSAYRPQTIGYGYLATEETTYNSDDWTFTADWSLAPWDMPYVGLGAALPSQYNWVVGTPDQSVYLYVDTHQPWGNPGGVYIVIQSAGWDRNMIRIGDFVGSWGTYGTKVEKQGNTLTFSLFDPNGGLMATGSIDDLAGSAPWLTEDNSRLFVGSIRGNNYNAQTRWDNFEVAQ